MGEQLKQIGFIGLGVMGEPICRNLAVKSGFTLVAFDRDPAPLERLKASGVQNGGSIRGVVGGSDVVFLSLPSGEVVSQLAHAPDGLLAVITAGQVVIDLSTSPVDTTRQ
ncbi:MAG: NAD(P)-binding domain-containing protein, partial [Proteobacteria bacterium]|nr:NAD(P)-binding domain-containing protein [Pseudomonadota bacterium]